MSNFTRSFAQQLTNAHGLGSHTVAYVSVPYKEKGCFWGFLIAGGMLTFIINICISFSYSYTYGFIASINTPPMYWVYITSTFLIMLAIIAAINFFPARPSYEDATYLFTEGFVIMKQNEPVIITRWEEIQLIYISADDYYFMTKGYEILKVNKPLYREYLDRYRYDYLDPQSLQYLTQLQGGSTISFGNVAITLSGISIQGIFYLFSEVGEMSDITFRAQFNTLDFHFQLPLSPPPTVVKRRPEDITVTFQGNMDLFETLLLYAIRSTDISYSRDDFSAIRAHYPYKQLGWRILPLEFKRYSKYHKDKYSKYRRELA